MSGTSFDLCIVVHDHVEVLCLGLAFCVLIMVHDRVGVSEYVGTHDSFWHNQSP